MFGKMGCQARTQRVHFRLDYTSAKHIIFHAMYAGSLHFVLYCTCSLFLLQVVSVKLSLEFGFRFALLNPWRPFF